ncbi:hypothetical protein [Limosilactobacillus mucosae]|uniref:hypothetical protein n=1 Tax=Limosilactobacillus mucosae TaxID=97478 RepID=UPI0022E7DDC5|nr:hypothetical protein [Limosilactobacillus mucosae]
MNLEDFEFSTRFLMQGKKTQYASDALVYQEAIAKARPFIRHRSRARWVQRLRHQPRRLTLAVSG